MQWKVVHICKNSVDRAGFTSRQCHEAIQLPQVELYYPRYSWERRYYFARRQNAAGHYCLFCTESTLIELPSNILWNPNRVNAQYSF